jgi:hypothetical protein
MTDTTTITIDASPPNARSDPSTGIRSYTWQGKAYPSVTSIRRVAGLPHALAAWQVSRVIERATLDLATLNAMMTRERKPRERVLEKNRIEEASRWLRAASTEERDASAALGTAVHDAAAKGLRPHEVPDVVTFVKDGKPCTVDGQEVRGRLRWYRDWLLVSGAVVEASEFQVVNETVGYAGSVDAIVRFPGGARWLVDYKTGTGTYPDHAVQLIAYRRAEFAFRDDAVDEATTALLRSVVGMAVLHIADDGWKFHVVPESEELWAAFRGLHAFATWVTAHPSMDTLVSLTRASGERDISEARIRLGGEQLAQVMGEAA